MLLAPPDVRESLIRMERDGPPKAVGSLWSRIRGARERWPLDDDREKWQQSCLRYRDGVAGILGGWHDPSGYTDWDQLALGSWTLLAQLYVHDGPNLEIWRTGDEAFQIFNRFW